MAEWYPGVVQVIDNGYGGSRGGAAITGAVIHHAASTDALGYVAGYNNRSSHPTYYVDKDGKVYGIVHPDRRPFSTANPVDASAVTFEVENLAAGGDWPVSQLSMDAVSDVIAFHAAQSPRAGHPIVKNKPVVTQTGFWVGWHSQYAATACPGPFLLSQIDDIIAKANAASGVAAPAAPLPAAPPATPASAFSPEVLWQQERLVAHGFNPGPLDGIRGPMTIAATKMFQKAKGLDPDGIVGPATRPRLAAAPNANAKRPTLRRGATGTHVRYLQERLSAHGYRIKVDGIFGPDTSGIVYAFQKAHRLTPDRIVGPVTWAELG